MKKMTFAASGILTVVLGTLAQTAAAATTYEEADVLSSTPIYRTVEITSPQRECWEEEVARTDRRYERDQSATPTILGAVIGGALGNAVGHNKSNKRVGTVVGGVLGGSIGADIGRNNRSRDDVVTYDTVERCRTVQTSREEEKLIGYDVRYSYNGSENTVRMDRDPGDTVRVRVKVEPVL